MVKYEFELYAGSFSGQPELIYINLASNTEAENTADRWLRQKRSEIRAGLRPWMTKSERKEILSELALLHINISSPISRDEFGQVVIYDRRRTR
jgi:hypothetical protein